MLTKNQIKNICIHLSNKNNKNIYVKEEEKSLYKVISKNDDILSRIERAKVYDNIDIIFFVLKLKLSLLNYKYKNN